MARPAGFEPATLGLAYQLRLSTPQYINWVCGLDYLFTITGVARIVSTDPLCALYAGFLGIAISLIFYQLLRFPRYSAIHFTGSPKLVNFL